MRDLSVAIFLSLFIAAVTAAQDLQARIDAAEPGATIELGPGVYRGGIVVSKPISLVGHGWPTIDGGGRGDVIILAARDCRVSGLVIRGSGDSLDHENTGIRVLAANAVIEDNRFQDVLFGIDLKLAPGCRISRNHISSKPLDIARRGDALRLFRSDDCVIEQNVIENGRDALLWYSNRVIVRDNVSRNNRYGFHLMFANQVTLEGNLLCDNSVGVYLMYGRSFTLRGNRFVGNRGPSGYGVGLKEIDAYTIEGNLFSGNRVGVYIDGSPYTRRPGSAVISGNTFACNDIGMTVLPAVRGNRIVGNNFIDNIEQVAVQGRGGIDGNEFAHGGRGNFWSDYGGYDADHDGVGDQPYRARKLFESLIDREPKLRLMLFSPAHDALEFIGRALPAVQPEAKFADPAPLMRPVELAVAGSGQSQRGALAAVGAAMVCVAGIIAMAALGVPRIRHAPARPSVGVVPIVGGAA
ncbi:nitrous oxide reductase family maturation protein NosD [Fontivita pretiosa]|uniref:nitrous oxide reductase family maturation protein NosD n=1 Tax=Fontivita pretiosa TaxID=2989684 RepID=UPI003D172617